MKIINLNYYFTGILVLWILLLTSCTPPCEEPDRSGINFGTYYLSKNLNDWFVDYKRDSIKFKSSNGTEAKFIIKYKAIDDFTDYSLKLRSINTECGIQTRDWFEGQYQYVVFTSAQAALNISSFREKEEPKDYPSDANWRFFSALPEQITITIGNDDYYFKLNSDTITQLKTSITPFSSTYTNVIELKRLDSINAPAFVKAVYYKKMEGIVSFEFLNGEIWERQQ